MNYGHTTQWINRYGKWPTSTKPMREQTALTAIPCLDSHSHLFTMDITSSVQPTENMAMSSGKCGLSTLPTNDIPIRCCSIVSTANDTTRITPMNTAIPKMMKPMTNAMELLGAAWVSNVHPSRV